jgi:eukaryotic-like serine/threonine-protein kinase
MDARTLTTTKPHGEAALPVGALFAGRYLVRGHVGTGGMGHVYRVLDQSLEEEVALKTVLPHTLSRDALSRFRDEVRLARKVTHKNVARVYDIGEHGDVHFLTMELIEGESLRRRLRRGARLPVGDALAIAADVADGIAAAHAAGVVHSDLKPGNVMIDSSGGVHVIDFGVAHRVAPGLSERHRAGTLEYMAPEQLVSGEAGTAADVYALGLLLFEMLAGARPFHGDTGQEVARARVASAAPDVRIFVGVSDAVSLLVERLLARDPSDRPSASDAARELRRLAEREPEEASTRPDPWEETTELIRFAPAPAPGALAYTLAVLPFRLAGEEDGLEVRNLAAGLTETLRQILTLTRGLRVRPALPPPPPGASKDELLPLSPSADTDDGGGRPAGLALDVDAIVEGTIRRAGDAIHIEVQLLEVESGKRLWSSEYQGRVGSVVDMQDRAAKKIAERLRLQLSTNAFKGTISDEAMAAYLSARPDIRQGAVADVVAGYDVMERCLTLAPEFLPAWAARALAAARLWMLPYDQGRDWMKIAHDAVTDALSRAAGIPDTHLAAALHAEQRGAFRDAVKHLEDALKLAPAFAEAHELLGRLEVESGRVTEGVRRLRLAADLDRRCLSSLCYVERAARFRGRHDVAARTAARTARESRAVEPLLLTLRIGLWTGHLEDRDVVARRVGELAVDPPRTLFRQLLEVVDGAPPAQLLEALEELARQRHGTRYAMLMQQLIAEICGMRGPRERVLAAVESAVAGGLFDLEWLDHCPALESVMQEPRFLAARASVASRVA